jgi:hypothetical protein
MKGCIEEISNLIECTTTLCLASKIITLLDLPASAT